MERCVFKNKNLEIHIDLPKYGYQQTRFDWTGKIVKVKFQDILISSTERINDYDITIFGKGFYNEFGIEHPIGYEEANPNGWFHKIGVGALQRDNKPYDFSKLYAVRPLDFEMQTTSNKLIINCQSDLINGYAYQLKKEIELLEDGWRVQYDLHNTGEKIIQTDEYNHNFVAINQEFIGENYILKFPFEIQPTLFEETVNPDNKVNIGERIFNFKGEHNNPFFFSNLSGGKMANASWELINTQHNISLSEIGNFQTKKINLWGWKHVISPELFFEISLPPNQSVQWSRTYQIKKIKY